MNMRALFTAAVVIAGVSAPCLALANPLTGQVSGEYSSRLVQKVACDPNGEGKQANCMRECDDDFRRSANGYNQRTEEDRKAEKTACEKKCGC